VGLAGEFSAAPSGQMRCGDGYGGLREAGDSLAAPAATFRRPFGARRGQGGGGGEMKNAAR